LTLPTPQTPRGSGESQKVNNLREKGKADEKWRVEVQLQIAVARREQKQIKEPAQSPLMTTAEYQHALKFVPNFKNQYPVEGPIRGWFLRTCPVN
jgi:hypothetical protein